MKIFTTRLKTVATFVVPKIKIEQIREDSADNRVLECAVEGNADFIVSGDKHLLELEEFQGIVILDPKSFLTLLNFES